MQGVIRWGRSSILSLRWLTEAHPCINRIRRGESGDEGLGGPLGSPAGCGRVPARCEPEEQDAGDPKGPPSPSSSSLAPTDVDGLIGRPPRSPRKATSPRWPVPPSRKYPRSATAA